MTVSLQDKFEQVNDHARAILYDLLREWFPLGRMISKTEYGVANLNGDEGESLSINIKTGKWKEFAGGPGGYEPLGLYAHAFCNGDRNRAFRELRAKFNFSDDAPPPKRKPPVLKVVKPEEPEEWQPIVPPPDDVPGPNVTGHDHVFIYRDQGGRLLRYVVRNDAKGSHDKWVRPLTYGLLKGKPGWELRGPNDPKSLYGLERLDNAPVLLQEGEKKTDQMQRLLKDYACLSLTGGAAAINHNDLTPLAKRVVYYSPDNDAAGKKASLIIADRLVSLGATVMLVDVFSHGFPEKWDLGNAYEDGWTAEQIEAFLKDNAKPYEPGSGDVDQEPDEYEQPADEEGGSPTGSAIIPLGHDHGLYYYLSRSARQVVALTAAQHNKLHLMALADRDKHWGKTRFMGEKMDWEGAANALMRACEVVGIYNPDRIRGRGAWLDEGRAILHLGESLMVDGSWQSSLMLSGSPFVYEAAGRLNQTVADPLRNAEANKLLQMCRLLRWDKPQSAVLAAGFIVVSIICGTLHWRPSVWITGGSNSGKTTFLRDIVMPILGKIAVQVQSKTTEAGLRQTLNTDARPVIFDEAEAEMLADKARMQAVIDLVRQSSSEGGAEIIKGTQNQSGAKRYRIRSCFLFSSINVALDHLADESRITVLDLYNPGLGELDADGKRWAELQALMAETVGNALWCAGMVARSVWLMKVIRANAETFKWAVAEKMKSSRVGDQLGTLLAGAYALNSDREITPQEAREWLERRDENKKLVNDLTCVSSAEAEKDEERLTSRLMQQRIKVDMGDRIIERNVGEVIELAEDSAEKVAWVYQNALKAHGIKLEGDGIWISNTHHAIKGWLKDSPWSSQWGRSLKRLPGAKTSEPKVIVFGKHDRAKAVWVPLATLAGNDLP
jgi:putative DNA primase/helicase